MLTLVWGMVGPAGGSGEGPGMPPRLSLKEMKALPIHRNQEIQEKLQGLHSVAAGEGPVGLMRLSSKWRELGLGTGPRRGSSSAGSSGKG